MDDLSDPVFYPNPGSVQRDRLALHADDRKERGCPHFTEYGCGRPSDLSYLPLRRLDDFRARRFDRHRSWAS